MAISLNGFIANNLEEFSEVIENIVNNKDDIRKIQENAHNDILHKYDFSIVSKNYKNLYSSLDGVIE